jgi:hypothetical protein
VFILVVIAILYGCAGTVSGIVQVQNADGSFGSAIEGASLTFEKEDGSSIAREVSGSAGRYELSLETGRYIVNATHANYVYIGDDPTYLVVEVGSNTANFFMEPR